MSTTWILTAHRAGAHLYESRGAGSDWQLVEDVPHPEGRLKDGEIDTDRPGHVIDRHRPHAMEREQSATDRLADDFARELADRLSRARAESRFGRLVLVAAPRFLGRLRDALDGPTQATVAASLAKDFPSPDPRAIRAALADTILV
ncbi:MAG: host attachment protein [Sandaracinaceae bacterium]|nr:host attachment protein [Sandaracinaceae bacterium]